MAVADPAIKDVIEARAHYMDFVAPVLGAIAVVVVGRLRARRHALEAAAHKQQQGADFALPSKGAAKGGAA
jgi:hypothetical protein